MRKNAWTETGMVGSFYFEHKEARLLKQRLKQEEDQHTDVGPPGPEDQVCPKRSAKLDKALDELKQNYYCEHCLKDFGRGHHTCDCDTEE